jgi:ceramide glucosyltransferase
MGILAIVLSVLALLSLALQLWQFFIALRFPLHKRRNQVSFAPPATLLKPLKGCDLESETCLRSWLTQQYSAPLQILFGVASAADPVVSSVRKLIAEFPQMDVQLVICTENLGTNAKVSTLIQLERLAKHPVIIVSDADVFVPPDFLTNIVLPLQVPETGLVNCFYQLANPSTLAMRWEAVAINADFWSQVLQSRSLKPLDFALGAVMATRMEWLKNMGGFTFLADFLADDYQLGHQIAKKGGKIELCPIVVECREAPKNWGAIWRHQLRWARTIRVCQAAPYFFSILSNASLWPILMAISCPELPFIAAACFALALRIFTAQHLQWRLTGQRQHFFYDWLVPVKDLLQVVIWALSFVGNTVEWRGHQYRVQSGGKLIR